MLVGLVWPRGKLNFHCLGLTCFISFSEQNQRDTLHGCEVWAAPIFGVHGHWKTWPCSPCRCGQNPKASSDPSLLSSQGKDTSVSWLTMGLKWALKLWEEKGMSGLQGSGSSQQAPTLPLSTLPTLDPKGRTSELDWPNSGPKWAPGKPFHHTSREVNRMGVS